MGSAGASGKHGYRVAVGQYLVSQIGRNVSCDTAFRLMRADPREIGLSGRPLAEQIHETRLLIDDLKSIREEAEWNPEETGVRLIAAWRDKIDKSGAL